MEGMDAGSVTPNSSVTPPDVECGDANSEQFQSLNPTGGTRSRYFEKCTPLREAAMKGNWRAAKKLIEGDRRLCTECITETGETVLHVAAGAGKTHFFKKLIELKENDEEALERTDANNNTAFCYAVTAGAKAIAEMMLQRNPSLLAKCGVMGAKPLYYAALFGCGEMAIFLYNKMKEERKGLAYKEQKDIFFACLNAHLYDVALELLNDNLQLAKDRCAKTTNTALHFLARNPSAFRSTTRAAMDTVSVEHCLKLERGNRTCSACKEMNETWLNRECFGLVAM